MAPVIGERRQLINVAYRLLGSMADAEDAVQEAYARWYALSGGQQRAIDSPGAWLTTVAIRVCLSQLGSARVRREQYVGEWLPEPLPDPAEWNGGRSDTIAFDPVDRVTLDESVGMALLVVLDSMSPAQRVAFVLHDVFRYPFAEVARIVGRTPAACRQLASSARRRVRASRALSAPTARDAAVVRDLKRAWEASDINALVGLLDPQATAVGDGGGLVSTLRRPLRGGETIARHLVRLPRRPSGTTLVECTVNGRPGLVGREGGAVVTVYAFDVARDRIRHLWAVRNPEKLRSWAPSSAAAWTTVP
ncbi:RNA polymerase sigma factor SigJ [Streptomyces sp. NA04227]|uniref:RNA polymerase sigma factor SigJ n=1 Tax=Streptomyces sp. NA04227 TaxID=2742136 RepID=UPI0020CA343E|nr:RNA polymerase sigma factor SigJ [Streptomyces sp. NA04227]